MSTDAPQGQPAAAPVARFDPIVDLRSGNAVAWTIGTQPARPSTHGEADRQDSSRQAALLLVAARALRDLPPGAFLCVPVDAAGLVSGALAAALEEAGDLEGIALLVSGRPGRQDAEAVVSARRRGALIGLDPAALGDAQLTPDLLVIGQPLGALAAHDAAPRTAVRSLVRLARRAGALSLAAGVGSVAQAATLFAEGVALAQGAVFGPPAAAPVQLPALVAGRLLQVSAGRLLEAVAERAPELPMTAPLSRIAEVCLADDGHDWLVLVDRDGRPRRLVDRAAMLRGEPFEVPCPPGPERGARSKWGA